MSEYINDNNYNTGASILISDIPANEMDRAIKEWSQGNLSMERLIRTCLENGVETTGSHVGPNSYLSLFVNNSHEKVKKMLKALQEVEGTYVSVDPDGGNPLSGPGWYKSYLGIHFSAPEEKEASEILDKLSDSLSGKNVKVLNNDGVYSHIVDFNDFFAEKESGLSFTCYCSNNQYKFTVMAENKKERAEYVNNLLEKAGFKSVFNDIEGFDIFELLFGKRLNITANSPEEFNNKMGKCKDILFNEWSLGLRDEITPSMGLNTKALIIRRKRFNNKPYSEFRKWYLAEGERMEKEYNAIKDLNVDSTKKVNTREFLKKLGLENGMPGNEWVQQYGTVREGRIPGKKMFQKE